MSKVNEPKDPIDHCKPHREQGINRSGDDPIQNKLHIVGHLGSLLVTVHRSWAGVFPKGDIFHLRKFSRKYVGNRYSSFYKEKGDPEIPLLHFTSSNYL